MATSSETSLASNTAIVTGAGSGIGLAISEELTERGWRVILADINEDAALRAAQSLADGLAEAEGIGLDVADATAFSALVDDVITRHGAVDLLVNNAGTAVGGEVLDLGLEHWNRVIDVNLRGVIHGVHAVYPHMATRRRGHIVNVASVAGLAPTPLMAPYGTTKSAVVGLSLALRAEAARYGVGVTVLCPGPIVTPLLDRTAPDGMDAPASAPDTRTWVTRDLGKPYPAPDLAKDLLRAVRRNRAILIAPRRARITLALLRLMPSVGYRMAERRVRQELGPA